MIDKDLYSVIIEEKKQFNGGFKMNKFTRKNCGEVFYCIEDEDFEDDYTQKRTLYIDYIGAYQTQCGQGKELMEKFIKKVKKQYNLCAITLIASDEHGTPLPKLEKFYKQFGFKEVHRTEYGIEFQLDI